MTKGVSMDVKEILFAKYKKEKDYYLMRYSGQWTPLKERIRALWEVIEEAGLAEEYGEWEKVNG